MAVWYVYYDIRKLISGLQINVYSKTIMSQAITAIIDADANTIDIFAYETAKDRDDMFPELENLKEQYPLCCGSSG